jgi:glycosyltransferase involved in cell wall biosynthesis
MKILMTVKKKGWSGESAIILDLAVGLHGRGHEVHLAAKDGSVTGTRARDQGLSVMTVHFETGPLHLASQWADFKKMGRFILENEIDLIHAHASWDNWLGGVVSKKGPRPVPLIRTKHNLKTIRIHFMNRWLYNGLSDWIIAPSNAVKNHLNGCPIVNPSRVHFIPYGIRADLFQSHGGDPASLREKLNISPDELVVAYISRLSRRKNPESVIDAARLLADAPLPLRFILVGGGDGTYQAELEERAEGLANLSFPGHWDDVPGLLSAIDIFVLTSHTEAFGLAPLEAMAMKKPVIVSPAEGFRDFLKQDQNGIMLEKNDAQSLAAAILRLAGDPDLRARMGEEGRKTVEADFTTEVMVDRTIDFYEKVRANEA